MRIIHTADWHLGPSRHRIDPETGLNARLMDFYRCARFAIEDGIERGADLVLHCGDVFHGCRPTPTEAWIARQAIAPALDSEVPVVMLLGNHDAPRSPAERHALDLLRDLPGLTIADRPMLLNVWQPPHRVRGIKVEPPEMATPDGSDLVLQIACLPHPSKQLLLSDERHRRLDPGQLNELVRERMMDCARGLAAQCIEGIPALLAGHFAVDVAQAGGQNRLMMLGGEWTLNVHDLAALPFEAICLGHIHKAQILREQPWIGYCGSPEAVTFGEEHDGDKGYFLIDMREVRA